MIPYVENIHLNQTQIVIFVDVVPWQVREYLLDLLLTLVVIVF